VSVTANKHRSTWEKIMSWDITDEEIASTSSLSPEDRYGYFVEKTLEHRMLWSLKNEEGWVLGEATEDLEAIPVWPHARYAERCATGAWANHNAESITLDVFLNRFVPGMLADKRVLAVFEVPGGTALVTDPAAVAHDLSPDDD
jgi:hypothetical protein